MTLFKCKMCGGNLEISDDMTVCECEYCGTNQTVPRLDSDRKANLYDRANHFRRNNDFDKARLACFCFTHSRKLFPVGGTAGVSLSV